jgi:simple sugar transport system permease protein
MTFIIDLLAATFRNATPLVFGTIGETYAERSGVLNLGIEGTMYAGAFAGFATAYLTGSLGLGLVAAILVGLAAGALMALLTVTLGANQHVSGIGLTIGLIGACDFANRLLFSGTELVRIEPFPILEPFAFLGPTGGIVSQYALTYVAFLVVAPLAWWVLGRSSFGLAVRAVGENPEAADAATARPRRYAALMAAARSWPSGVPSSPSPSSAASPSTSSPTRLGLRGAGHLRAVADLARRARRAHLLCRLSLQLRLRILPGWDAVPFELLLALPFLAVILALAISGRNVAYPGAYLKPYRRA